MRIGELARASGMTVRALRHYDEIGLLVPSERTHAGYRVYAGEDVARLFRIVALRGLGLSLADVAAALGGHDVHAVVERRLAALDEQLAEGRRLRERLARVLDGASPHELMDAIERMTMYDRHYTPDQQDQLAERRAALGEDGLAAAERDWAELLDAVRAEQAAGTDPSDPRVQELAARWRALIQQFTGGDAGLHDSLNAMYETEGAARASRGALDGEVMDYMRRAMQG
jgi:DNA-binding transcriptional MerR regulator